MGNYEYDSSQKILLFVLLTCLVLIVLLWQRGMKHEGFSPYRGTGGISGIITGYKYLDEYSDKDWYEMNPWIYPSISYDNLLFKYQRENNKYLEEKRKIMLENLKNLPQ